MSKNLVIVESPAKAKTIEGFLGKDYIVKSSFGHVRDLSEKGLSIEIDNNFNPVYQVMDDKKAIITELRKLSKDAQMVWLATDEDREGEAISWHLAETLGLDEKKTKRIVFHEITKTAIEKAIANPRTVDKNLVDAQQARRILDRLVGYELSPVLWKKVKPSLSAGRVQSVSVRLIVEREREITNFKSEAFFKITAIFKIKGTEFKAELSSRIKSKAEALKLLEACKSSNFIIEDFDVKPSKRTPAAPFTTSTLQQEASRKLGFSVSQTMTLAQKLYEAGKITYMRTDSLNLSDTAMEAIKKEVSDSFGNKYYQSRKFKNKSKGAQEAHEAIRPTYLNQDTIDGDAREKKLYELIWKRSVASQMADAELEKTTVKIGISNVSDYQFIAKGEVIKFDGFLKLYIESTDDEEDEETKILPKMNKGEMLEFLSSEAIERFTMHPPRYTEASLVKKLEELGIGRPSTYAPTISTVQKRGYVVKEDREGSKRNYDVLTLEKGKITEKLKSENTGAEKAKLFPTDIGMVVNDFLVDHFHEILDFNFTADVEKAFDEIAEGQLNWNKMIDKFYKTFHPTVEKTMLESSRATGERELGIDPTSGKPVFAKIGRFGPLVQIGSTEAEEKPKFASLKNGQSIETITLADALELFKLPRVIGKIDEKDVVANIGRFGPYISFNKQFFSLKKEDDPMTISLDRAIELMAAKAEEEKNRLIKEFKKSEIQILNGRFGAYIKKGKNNYKIPKENKAEDLTEEMCLEIIEKSDSSEKPKKSFSKRGKK